MSVVYHHSQLSVGQLSDYALKPG